MRRPPVAQALRRQTILPGLVLGATLWTISASPCPDAPLLPAYAHNDYRNRGPLIDALAEGYRGIEVDVCRSEQDLLVGHDRSELRRDRTLKRLYLEPLREMLRRCGRILPGGDALLLNIEIKEKSPRTLRALLDLLAQYPDLFDGALDGREAPVRVVFVGWRPSSASGALNWPRYARVQIEVGSRKSDARARDGPPVGLVSLDYSKSVAWNGHGVPAAKDDSLLARASRLADSLAVPLRAHQVPPDRAIYRWLLDRGVDLIGVKELKQGSDLLRSLQRN